MPFLPLAGEGRGNKRLAIKIQGTVFVPAPPAQVWDSLFDAPTLARIASRVPGVHVERFERISPTHYEGAALVSVAMVKGRYDGRVDVVEQRPSEYVKLQAGGIGGGNRANGDITLTLAGDQHGGTQLDYDAQGNMTGPLANLGQRLVDSVGRQFIDQGVRALSEELAGQTPRTPLTVPAGAEPALRFPVWAAALIAAIVLVLLAILAYAVLPR